MDSNLFSSQSFSNPNFTLKEELSNDCYYDYTYNNSYNYDVYSLYNDNDSIFIAYTSKTEKNNINIMKIKKNLKEIIFSLKDHKNDIKIVKYFLNPINHNQYLVTVDIKSNIILYDILSETEYKIKYKKDAIQIYKHDFHHNDFCLNDFGINNFGINKFGMNKFGINKFGMNKFGGCCNFLGGSGFNNPTYVNPEFGINDNFIGGKNIFNHGLMGNLQMQGNSYLMTDFVEIVFIFFTEKINYFIVLYRGSGNLTFYNLETGEKIKNINNQSLINSMISWFDIKNNINYLITTFSSQITITNPVIEDIKSNEYTYCIFEKNVNLSGRNFVSSIIYNKNKEDYLLSYTNYRKINLINLNKKIITITIELDYNINCIIDWNKKYIIAAIENIFNKGVNGEIVKIKDFVIIDIDIGKIITKISESDGDVKKCLNKVIINNEEGLIVQSSDHKLKLWKNKENIKFNESSN